jgi:hypothetical protein
MSKKVGIADVFMFEAGARDAVAEIHELLFCEDAPPEMNARRLAEKVRQAWAAGNAPCWEDGDA